MSYYAPESRIVSARRVQAGSEKPIFWQVKSVTRPRILFLQYITRSCEEKNTMIKLITPTARRSYSPAERELRRAQMVVDLAPKRNRFTVLMQKLSLRRAE